MNILSINEGTRAYYLNGDTLMTCAIDEEGNLDQATEQEAGQEENPLTIQVATDIFKALKVAELHENAAPHEIKLNGETLGTFYGAGETEEAQRFAAIDKACKAHPDFENTYRVGGEQAITVTRL